MTPTKFFAFSFFQWVIVTLVKLLFFNQVFFGGFVNNIFLWTISVFVVVILARRFGVINYLESIFLIIFWVIGGLVGDLIVTSYFVGLQMFTSWQLWANYFFMAFALFIFHKKRHIQIRKDLHAKHH